VQNCRLDLCDQGTNADHSKNDERQYAMNQQVHGIGPPSLIFDQKV
jgi:hypothetical protein